jgi:hypothetical protein
MANICEDGESSDSDDGGLPSVRKIVAHAMQKVVIDLTHSMTTRAIEMKMMLSE